MNSNGNLNALLKSKGLKITPTRERIFGIFTDSNKPLSAEDLILELKGKKISDVTIYRTLESFEKIGILRQLDLRKGSVFYEIHDDHHHHIVCKACGLLEDFEMCAIENATDRILEDSKKFKIIDEHSFELFGFCNTCARKQNI